MKELIYNNLQRWIPPSDVDGIDLKPEIASTARNIIFQNGFFKNAVNTVNKVLPINVQAAILSGYELKGYTNFIHSTEGFNEVYILWENDLEELRLYLNNDILKINDESEYTICIEAPNNINFNLINDELKINLNCRGMLSQGEVLLNLSLLFFKEEVIYVAATSTLVMDFTGTGTDNLLCSRDTANIGDTLEIKISDKGTEEVPMDIDFVGTGVNDLIVEELNRAANVYEVKIDSMPYGLAFIVWRVNSGTWSDPIMLYLPLTINGQLRLSMGGLINHVIGDTWTITTYAGLGESDKFIWRLNGGSWSSELDINPLYLLNPMSLAGFTVYFLSALGHDLNDLWTISIEQFSGIRLKNAEEWGVYPRWIGWAKQDIIPEETDIYENFEGGIYIAELEVPTIGSNPIEIGIPTLEENFGNPNPSKCIFVEKKDNTGEPKVGYFNIKSLKMIGQIKFTLILANMGVMDSNGDIGIGRMIVEVINGSITEYRTIMEFPDNSLNHKQITLDIPFKGHSSNNRIIKITLSTPRRVIGLDPVIIFPNTVVGLDDITIVGNEVVVLEKILGGQRGLIYKLKQLKDSLIIQGGKIRIPKAKIDPRVVNYEVYVKTDSIYYLSKRVNLEDVGWNDTGEYLEFISYGTPEIVETLNFNYGLGDDVRVDTQHIIYSEASFNGRVYLANKGYKILQSHIAGSGRIQPDSFPYNEEDFLGFIEEAKSFSIQTLFIINNNFLMIYMTDGYSLYQINSSPYTGRFQKELRMLTSSFTGFNSKSLTRIINATSPTIGAYWVTNEGIWYHDGSLGSVPINLITDTHRNYWKTVEKTNFGFYDYQDNEYWYATKVYSEIRDGKGADREFTEFIIYEINFKTFRFVRLEKAYYELAGYFGGKALLRTNEKIGILDKASAKSLAGLVETHWNDIGTEYYNKIAQALVLELKGNYTGGTIYLKAQFDNQSLIYSFAVLTDEKRIIRLFPESVRFKSVKLYVLLSNTDLAEISISSFKLLYTEDGIGRFGEFFDHQVIVEEGGYGRAYGRYYGGSNPTGTGGGYGTQYGKHYGN